MEDFRDIRVNRGIRVPNVRLINSNGEQVGVVDTRQALAMAQEQGLDLIEISKAATPPVCKIGDFGKYKYELAKKQKDAKKKQHVVHLKEIKMHPKTDSNDYAYRIKHAREFLEGGDKVKITVAFKGRELAYLDFGRVLLGRAESDLKEYALCEIQAKMEGRNMSSVFTPNKVVLQKLKTEREKRLKEQEKKKQEKKLAEAAVEAANAPAAAPEAPQKVSVPSVL